MMKTSVSAWRMKVSSQLRIGGGALRVDIDQNIDAVFQIGPESVCAMSRNNAPCTFACSRNSPASTRVEKFLFGKEMIIFAFDFPGARRARRAGNGVNKVRRLAKRIAKRRLAGAGWRGNNKQNSVTA